MTGFAMFKKQYGSGWLNNENKGWWNSPEDGHWLLNFPAIGCSSSQMVHYMTISEWKIYFSRH
jgi:hypothetical protein